METIPHIVFEQFNCARFKAEVSAKFGVGNNQCWMQYSSW